jgi:hypothetical protein
MPTVIEPKTDKESKPQLVPSTPAEPELFSAEIAMEKNSSNFAPLLLAGALVLVIGGLIYYFVKSAHDVVSVSQATTIVSDILRDKDAAVTKFSTGTVDPPNGQQDPQYKLLSRAGVIFAKPKPKDTVFLMVALTEPGQTLLNGIDGVKKVARTDGGNTYTVPLAERQLVSIDKITLPKPHIARVDFTWKWVPNRLGREFDASGELVKSFSTWERSTLIKSNGADFFSAEPAKGSILLRAQDDGSWVQYTQ